MNETDIIKGCLKNDRASQKALYEQFYSKMLGVCLRYSKSSDEAKDILHEGFMKVFDSLKNFKSTGSFEGWMKSIMVSAALSKYRNKSSQMRPVTLYNADVHDVAEEVFFVSKYDEKELVKRVQQLPPAYRLVFNLFVFEGMKHREIAEALHISEGTSKSNLSDARKILQASLTVKKKIAL